MGGLNNSPDAHLGAVDGIVGTEPHSERIGLAFVDHPCRTKEGDHPTIGALDSDGEVGLGHVGVGEQLLEFPRDPLGHLTFHTSTAGRQTWPWRL